MHFLPLLTVILLPFSVLSFTFSTPSRAMCKCLCFSNSTIIPLYLPKDPLHPCLTCTRQFCLDQKLAACVGAESGKEDLDTGKGDEGDVEARCFQRDSPKSHVLVLLFIIVTSALLVVAGLKQYGIDLQSAWSQNGMRGIVMEMTNSVRNIGSSRRRPTTSTSSGPLYTSMPT